MPEIPIADMTLEQLRDFTSRLITALDELDGDDFFGTEGWRHYLGIE